MDGSEGSPPQMPRTSGSASAVISSSSSAVGQGSAIPAAGRNSLRKIFVPAVLILIAGLVALSLYLRSYSETSAAKAAPHTEKDELLKAMQSQIDEQIAEFAATTTPVC